MKLISKLKPYAKATVAVLGFALTVASQLLVPGSTASTGVTIAITALTAFGVWRVPNAKPVDAAVAMVEALKARHAATPATPPKTIGLGS